MSDNPNHSDNKSNSKASKKLTSTELLSKLANENANLRKLSPTNSILEIAIQQNTIREKLNPVSSVLKGLSTTTALSKLAKQQNAFREKLSPLFSFQDTIRELSKSPLREVSNNSALSIIMGGSTLSALAKLTNENSRTFNPTSSALDLIKSNPNLFSKQVSIFEKLNKHLYEINHLKTPTWLEQINSEKDYSKVSTLSAFEILNANTLSQIISEYPPDENVLTDVEEELDKMSSLIEQDEELKLEIEKLLKGISSQVKKRKKKNLKKQFADLKEPVKLFAFYLHLKWFKTKENWTLQNTYTLVNIVNSLILQTLILGVLIGKPMEDLIYGENESPHTTFVTIDNRTINYNVRNHDIPDWGVTSKDAKVYRRKSTKTDFIGIVFYETTVRIIRKKGGWLFIESAMTKFDKKTNKEVDFVSQGWIKQEFVSFEQE